MIWELNYHNNKPIFASLTSDGNVKILRSYEDENLKNLYKKKKYNNHDKNLLKSFMFRNRYIILYQLFVHGINLMIIYYMFHIYLLLLKHMILKQVKVAVNIHMKLKKIFHMKVNKQIKYYTLIII